MDTTENRQSSDDVLRAEDEMTMADRVANLKRQRDEEDAAPTMTRAYLLSVKVFKPGAGVDDFHLFHLRSECHPGMYNSLKDQLILSGENDLETVDNFNPHIVWVMTSREI